ncbi:DUF4367 domain-containing protein [Halobacillus halophilus]|uniref:DUF4367 domain-containing protein n=1 Tax=Halobacillus halophilus TaxID=1570 RepID=UPI001CD6F431|nr:DUF4367 domain-containing protein [Halobacillus halophilus]MCA1011629.1 DUF4367 domain-containing protein [Halobacillus halophilus]
MIKKLLFMALTLLIAAGCTSTHSSGENTKEQSKVQEDVEKVLEHIFTGPDQELSQFYEEHNQEEISNYYKDQFEPYFTEKYMDEAMKTNLVSSFHQKAYGNEVKMDINSMSVEQSEDKDTAYDFDTQIDVSNGQSAKVRGRVNTNEQGKITRIHYVDPQPLLHAFDMAVETEDGLFEYDRSRLASRTEDEAYQPKFPTVMPFEVDGVEIEAGPMNQKDTLLTFTFFSETGEMLELMTVKEGGISYQDLETEEVSIGEQTGQYAGKKGDPQRLMWKDGSITYELKGKVKDLSKEDLITVAESFQ